MITFLCCEITLPEMQVWAARMNTMWHFGSIANLLAKLTLLFCNLPFVPAALFMIRSRDYICNICTHLSSFRGTARMIRRRYSPRVSAAGTCTSFDDRAEVRRVHGCRVASSRTREAALHFRVTENPRRGIHSPRCVTEATHTRDREPAGVPRGMACRSKSRENGVEIQARHVTASLPRRDWPSRLFSRASLHVCRQRQMNRVGVRESLTRQPHSRGKHAVFSHSPSLSQIRIKLCRQKLPPRCSCERLSKLVLSLITVRDIEHSRISERDSGAAPVYSDWS